MQLAYEDRFVDLLEGFVEFFFFFNKDPSRRENLVLGGFNFSLFISFWSTDKERPRVDSCPKDIKKQTNQNSIRVTWDYPVFEDNFDRPPVQLRINSNRNPGASFPWGRYDVLYTATDRAGNNATCEFFVEVGRKLLCC